MCARCIRGVKNEKSAGRESEMEKEGGGEGSERKVAHTTSPAEAILEIPNSHFASPLPYPNPTPSPSLSYSPFLDVSNLIIDSRMTGFTVNLREASNQSRELVK